MFYFLSTPFRKILVVPLLLKRPGIKQTEVNKQQILGAVHKIRVRGFGVSYVYSQGVRGFVQCGHFSDKVREFFMNVRTFLRKKHQIFRILWCVCMDKEG